MLVSDVIVETRNHLSGGIVEERNKLASGIGSSDTSATLTYPLGSVDRGSKISISLEDMYVWAKSSQAVTIDRGQFGSSASSHSSGDLVYINPKFSNYQIFMAMNQELVALSAPANGLFGVSQYTLTYNPVIHGYDFPYSLQSIYEVRYTIPGATQEWFVSQDWEFTRASGSDFASGQALFIRDASPSQDMVIKVKTAFTQLVANVAADISTSNLPSSCYDILALGAAYRLSSPLEVARNDTRSQGDTRRANEVPPGATLGGSRELGRLRQQRINEEAGRLSLEFPNKSPRYPFMVG